MSVFEENSTLKLLQHFGNINMERFSDRLRLQKLAFLSQEMGLEGGFSFTYYHYGPYSPTLTKLLYKGIETHGFPQQVTLTEEEEEIAQQINELLGEQINDHDSLELFATIWYLLPIRIPSDEEQQEIIDTITENKPRFERGQIQEVMNRILVFKRNHGLS